MRASCQAANTLGLVSYTNSWPAGLSHAGGLLLLLLSAVSCKSTQHHGGGSWTGCMQLVCEGLHKCSVQRHWKLHLKHGAAQQQLGQVMWPARHHTPYRKGKVLGQQLTIPVVSL